MNWATRRNGTANQVGQRIPIQGSMQIHGVRPVDSAPMTLFKVSPTNPIIRIDSGDEVQIAGGGKVKYLDRVITFEELRGENPTLYFKVKKIAEKSELVAQMLGLAGKGVDVSDFEAVIGFKKL